MRLACSIAVLWIGIFQCNAAAAQTIAPACIHSGIGVTDSTNRPPRPKRFGLPPQIPNKFRDSVAVVSIRVDPNGHPDSVVVTGIPDAGYVRGVQATFLRADFAPALDHGCPTTGWLTWRLTSPSRAPGLR
jgi:hypothetical protein